MVKVFNRFSVLDTLDTDSDSSTSVTAVEETPDEFQARREVHKGSKISRYPAETDAERDQRLETAGDVRASLRISVHYFSLPFS